MEILKFLIIIAIGMTALIILLNIARIIMAVIYQDRLDSSDVDYDSYEQFLLMVKLLNKGYFVCIVIFAVIFCVVVFKTNPLE